MTTAEYAAFNQDTPAGMMIFNLDERKMQFLREETDASGRKTGFGMGRTSRGNRSA